MNPFAVDYNNLDEAIGFAQKLANQNPAFVQHVVKYPNRDNYNITMQLERAKSDGAQILWSSRGV